MPSDPTPLALCLAALLERGLLMAADARLPSVTSIVAGKPVSGSWWSHPSGREIYATQGALMARPDVLVVHLVNRKVTLVHRRLWPALLAVATSRDAWQTEWLARRESGLLERIERDGEVQVDAALAEELDADLKSLDRELEERLLVLGGNVHTESGAHARTLTSWKRWMKARRGARPAKGLTAAYARLDAAVQALGPSARVPWWPQRSLRRMSR